MSDGTVSTQYWVIPAAAQATLAQVQSQVMPAAQAVQTVSKTYVDQSIAELQSTLLTASGGTLSGHRFECRTDATDAGGNETLCRYAGGDGRAADGRDGDGSVHGAADRSRVQGINFRERTLAPSCRLAWAR